MNIVRVNETGLGAIKAFLQENHVMANKYGKDYFTDEMIGEWASEAERHAEEGHGCFIELRAFESVLGRSQTFELPDDGFEIETVADDE